MYTLSQKSTNILPRIGIRKQVSSRVPDEPIKLKRPLHAGDFSIVELIFSRRINLHVPRCTSTSMKASVSRVAPENSQYKLDHKSGLHRWGSRGN